MRERSMVRTPSTDVWARLARPLESRVLPNDDPFLMPAGSREAVGVAELIRRHLDATVPGGWELHVELQPVVETSRFVVKSRLTVLGVAREDFGEGYSLASASDDALAKAARRFGIGASEGTTAAESAPSVSGIRSRPIPMTTDQELVAAAFRADPVETPVRKPRVPAAEVVEETAGIARSTRSANARKDPSHRSLISAEEDFPSCPKCGDIMWDDRGAKKADGAPDFRCRRKGCAGTLWVDHGGTAVAPAGTKSSAVESASSADEEFPF